MGIIRRGQSTGKRWRAKARGRQLAPALLRLAIARGGAVWLSSSTAGKLRASRLELDLAAGELSRRGVADLGSLPGQGSVRLTLRTAAVPTGGAA